MFKRGALQSMTDGRAGEPGRSCSTARDCTCRKGLSTQIFFLFEKPAPKTRGRAREARIIKQKLSCHSATPGSPSWRRSRQAEQGRTRGVGVMERWALLRIDDSTTSAG